MIKAYLIHLAHKAKYYLKDKPIFRGRGVLLRLADKIISHPKRKIVLKTLYGFKLLIDPVRDNGVEKSIFYTGTYEAGTIHVLNSLLKPGQIFIDVGANIGLMTLFAANKVGKSGRVHSFEPQPETFKILAYNCALNKARNVYLSDKALGSIEKEGVIYQNMDINRGASSLVRKGETTGNKIYITTLDNYIESKHINEVHVVKIDIEGYEMEMLKGAKKLLAQTNAPVICIEYSHDVLHTADVGDVYDFIKAVNDYRIFKLTLSKEVASKLVEVTSKDGMPHHDNVFCFTEACLQKIDKSIFA